MKIYEGIEKVAIDKLHLIRSTAIVLATSFLVTAVGCSANKLDSNNSTPLEENTENINKENKNEIFDLVYAFVKLFNSTKADSIKLSTDGDLKLAVSYDEAMGAYQILNSVSKEDFISIYNGSNILPAQIINDSDNFALKMQMYYARAKEPSGVSELIKDEKSKQFFQKYENLHLEYNRASQEKKDEIAKKIISTYEEDFLQGADSVYEDIEPGVGQYIISVYPMLDSISWRNKKTPFPSKLIENLKLISEGLCSYIGSRLDQLYLSLEIERAVNEANNILTENKYSLYLEQYEKLLISVGIYNLDKTNLDSLENYYGDKSSESATDKRSNSKNNTEKGSKTENKTVTETDKSQMNKSELNQAEAGENKIQEELDEGNFYENIKGEALYKMSDSGKADYIYDTTYKACIAGTIDSMNISQFDNIINNFVNEYNSSIKELSYSKDIKEQMLSAYKSGLTEARNNSINNAKNDYTMNKANSNTQPENSSSTENDLPKEDNNSSQQASESGDYYIHPVTGEKIYVNTTNNSISIIQLKNFKQTLVQNLSYGSQKQTKNITL